MLSTNALLFPGSTDVYVRFHDILGTPRFSLLLTLIRTGLYGDLFDFSFFRNWKMKEAIVWYLTRDQENFLDTERINVHHFSKEENHRILMNLLQGIPYGTFAPVNLMNALILHPIIDHLHVYSEEQEEKIQDVAAGMQYQVRTVDYRYGPFPEIIRDARDQCTLITTSTQEARIFLDSNYPNRHIALIYPNQYDPIKQISDIYSNHASQVHIIDLSNRIQIWEEALL